MPVRDNTIIQALKRRYKLDGLVVPGLRYYIPQWDLTRLGLTRDQWWQQIQELDDAYLDHIESYDWDSLIPEMMKSELYENGSIDPSFAGDVLMKADPFRDTPFKNIYVDWYRVVTMAISEWRVRNFASYWDNDYTTLDRTALVEALLSVEEAAAIHTSESPRKRVMTDLFDRFSGGRKT